MNTYAKKVFGAGFMLATLMAAFAAYSQDLDEFEPAVDTSAIPEEEAPAVDTTPQAEEIENLEPGVPSAVLAADVTRDREQRQPV